jgi:ribosomal protein S18 acetylase RimI-like enzyme
MLLEKREFLPEDAAQWMTVYREGNQENADDFHRTLAQEEEQFAAFLREFFEQPENTYYIWEENGQWMAALRLTKQRACYYLEALETAPDQRRKGYGETLLRAVCEKLEKSGPITIRDTVSKRNLPSLNTHRACGFTVEQDPAMEDGRPNDRCYGLVYRTNR